MPKAAIPVTSHPEPRTEKEMELREQVLYLYQIVSELSALGKAYTDDWRVQRVLDTIVCEFECFLCEEVFLSKLKIGSPKKDFVPTKPETGGRT